MVKTYVGRVRAVFRVFMLYPDISFTTEGKAWNTRSQSSRKVPVRHDSVCSHGRLAGSQDK